MTQVRQRETQRIFEAAVARYQMYPEYCDSGIEWLGEIPVGWKAVRVKFVASSLQTGPFGSQLHSDEYVVGGIPVVNPSHIQNGRIVCDENVSVDEKTWARLSRHQLSKGDIVFARRGEMGRAGIVTADEVGWLCGTGSIRVRLLQNFCYPPYVNIVFSLDGVRDWLSIQSVGSTMENLNTQIIGELLIPLPPPDEQRAIAAFLDRQTGKLDALIAKKRELIATLHEKRSAIISHAVTKGLNPDAPMKDSGIEWLGEIPAGWEVVRLKFLIARIDSGFSPDCIDMPAGEGEWGVLKTGCVNGGVFHPKEHKTLPIDVDPLPQLEVNIGDVLMSRANGSLDLIGSVALVDKLPKARLLLSDKTFRFRFRQENCEPEFFVKVMGSSLGREQINLAVSGASGLANNIAKSSIMEMRITLPPIYEQREIIEFLRSEASHIAYLIAKAEETIERLQEYRAALIAAAVTGKIDVRGEVGVS